MAKEDDVCKERASRSILRTNCKAEADSRVTGILNVLAPDACRPTALGVNRGLHAESSDPISENPSDSQQIPGTCTIGLAKQVARNGEGISSSFGECV
jgi:hypothetical protein